MKVVSSLALVVAVGWISEGAAASKQIATVPLDATIYNGGQMAQAILTPLSSRETQIVLYVSGVPNFTAIPVHLYTYIYSGSCASHGPQPLYELNRFVNANFGTVGRVIRMWKSVPEAYDTLRSDNYALVVRAAPTDGDHDLFCGNLNS